MHLLPYHRYGMGKYHLLGRDYLWKGRKELSDEKLNSLKKAGQEEIPEIRIGG